MITPTLEKLILCGKASFKTFTAGGSQMNNLRVPNDRFIIIVGFTHFPYFASEDPEPEEIFTALVTQMNVSSEKSFNSFVFRNEQHLGITLNSGGLLTQTYGSGAPVQIDTYLVHESDVNFSFSKGVPLFAVAAPVVAPNEVPSKSPPLGYGREGNPTPIGNIPVEDIKDSVVSSEVRFFGEVTPPTAGKVSSFDQLQFPIEAGTTAFSDPELQETNAYPIVLVQYVEIQGNPTNIQASL